MSYRGPLFKFCKCVCWAQYEKDSTTVERKSRVYSVICGWEKCVKRIQTTPPTSADDVTYSHAHNNLIISPKMVVAQ